MDWLCEDLPCDISGRCAAFPGAHGVTMCIHCGKELVEEAGQWWTWDADLHPKQSPQCSIT